MSERAIRLVRPRYALYQAMAKVLGDLGDGIYDLSEQQFIGRLMSETGGALSPFVARNVYRQLMEEAGLIPFWDGVAIGCLVDEETEREVNDLVGDAVKIGKLGASL